MCVFGWLVGRGSDDRLENYSTKERNTSQSIAPLYSISLDNSKRETITLPSSSSHHYHFWGDVPRWSVGRVSPGPNAPVSPGCVPRLVLWESLGHHRRLFYYHVPISTASVCQKTCGRRHDEDCEPCRLPIWLCRPCRQTFFPPNWTV